MMDYKKLWIKLVEQEMQDKDLARMAGISIATVSRMRKKNNISVPALYRISKVMGCPMEDLFEACD